jgi:hypothetical protein
MLQTLFYMTIALHVSGIIISHLQEHKTTATTASGNRYTVLLSAAIVESWNRFECAVGELIATHNTLKPVPTFHDSSRQQYGITVTRCCSYSCFVLPKMGDSDARNM